MIEPTQDDIGRAVIYTPGAPKAPQQEGVITSFNQSCVFVRYSNLGTGIGTRREDLEYLGGNP